MTKIQLTETQQDRFDALREELADEYAGPYASVRATDVMEYLLDLADAADDHTDAASLKAVRDEVVDSSDIGSDDSASADGVENGDSSGEKEDEDSADEKEDKHNIDEEDDDEMLNAMLNLLDTHDDKWGEGNGDDRYQVELPDGSTEGARTKDDVRALLFKHY